MTSKPDSPVQPKTRTIVAEAPTSFTEAELSAFTACVREGGEVADQVLDRNVRNAECLVIIRQETDLAGVAALKNPLQSYRDRIARSAAVAIRQDAFPLELGYIFVVPAARRRGVASELVATALNAARDRGVFATVRADNIGMHTILLRAGFEKAGQPYDGRHGSIQLFLRSAD